MPWLRQLDETTLRKPSPPPIPLIDHKDLALLGVLPILGLLAWIAPEAAWPALADGVARLRSRWLYRQTAQEVATIHAVADASALGVSADRCWRQHLANHYLAWLQLLRCHRPGSWSPRVALVGREHLDAALAAGRGGILWVAPFVFSDLITKLACHRAGYRVSHLSRDTHGYSDTRFGRRLLNPIKTLVERRYLAERLVLSADNPIRPLRDLARRLTENRLVSITAAATGQRTRTMPFLEGAIQLATGAPGLAVQTRAPLLPVLTLRHPDGGFVTRVEPPLPLPAGLERDAAIAAILARYVGLLETWVLNHPDQFSLPYITGTAPKESPDVGKVAPPPA